MPVNFRFITFIVALTAISVFISPAVHAQLSITTFGATNAQACYEDAGDDHTTDTGECDQALDGKVQLTRRDVAHTHVNRGIILNRAGRVSEAIEDFDAALEISPSLAEAFLNRGNSYFLMEQFDSALADYETSLANGLRKAYAAWYNIGLVYDAKEMPEKAREAYEKVLIENPGYRPAVEKLERYKD